ncbi:threonine/homoserine/homoserine lactone efflux protein [Roseomonas alkaliterrae]|uniref:Threonine/homoserine/homoserine lactone efflux protein n=1 Tax=Neoroseomonas alkaliterrae TaxID=1452450 RepID=A0A840Y6B4_9PROT|nr:threonine/homoserine/homoserine lactone efflux protein [Neoroseomonas alkaliterrae]
MPFDAGGFLLYIGAALLLAVTPGPGIMYVAARSLSGGRGEGVASSLGTGIGGFIHVAAGALGLSALLLASAEAFTLVKLAGAAYLVWIGLRTIREAGRPLDLAIPPASGGNRAFREGILVEALNPKTAAFFLAFIPQFLDPAKGDPVAGFVVLGAVSVLLNTGVDLVVAIGAGAARAGMTRRARLVIRLRQGCGALLCTLGVMLALVRRPAH